MDRRFKYKINRYELYSGEIVEERTNIVDPNDRISPYQLESRISSLETWVEILENKRRKDIEKHEKRMEFAHTIFGLIIWTLALIGVVAIGYFLTR